MKRLLAAGAILGVALVAGCTPSSTSSVPAIFTPSTSPSSGIFSGTAVATPAATATPETCYQQVQDWSSGGAESDIQAIEGDLTSVSGDAQAIVSDYNSGNDATGDETTMANDLASLQTDSSTLQADPAPACAPELRADLSAGISDFETSATVGESGVTSVQAGDVSGGASLIGQANADMVAGAKKIAAATADIEALKAAG